MEAKLKSFSSSIFDCLIIPLQDRVDEWKKVTVQLDKEHNKELKRLRQEFKKRQICDSSLSSGSYRSKKHSSRIGKSKYDFLDSIGAKSIYGTIGSLNKSTSSLTRSMDSEYDVECNDRLLLYEELEKKAVRRALIEERSHFCMFVKFLEPVVEEEVSMIQEITHLQEIMDSLAKLTADPYELPSSSEDVISRLKLDKQKNNIMSFQSPPSTPSSLGSRKSSMCSISSYNSSSSGGTYVQPNKYMSLTHVSLFFIELITLCTFHGFYRYPMQAILPFPLRRILSKTITLIILSCLLEFKTTVPVKYNRRRMPIRQNHRSSTTPLIHSWTCTLVNQKNHTSPSTQLQCP